MKADNRGMYETRHVADTERTQQRVKRLTKEIRVHVKYIHNYPIFSSEWIELADSLKQISELAFTEKQNPVLKKDLSKVQGRKTNGTLWDQENGELAIRVLLEEGKLNFCLRILSELMATKRRPDYLDTVEAACTEGQYSSKWLKCLVESTEKALGLIILLCIQHVESLQICDTSALLTLCAEELDKLMHNIKYNKLDRNMKLKTKFDDADKVQANLVFYYLYLLLKHIPDITETSIMPIIQKKRILQKIIKKMNCCREYLPYETEAVAARFVDVLFTTEAFQSNQNGFIYDTFKPALYDFHDQLITLIELGYLRETEISTLRAVVYRLRQEKRAGDPSATWGDLTSMLSEISLDGQD